MKKVKVEKGDAGEATMVAAQKVSKYQTGSSHVGLTSQFDSLLLLFLPALAFLTFFSLPFFVNPS